MYRTGASQDGRESENQGGNTMSTNPQDGSRPTLVLVHGAWADGSGWQGVYDQLNDTYSVRIVQEPTFHSKATSRRPRWSLASRANRASSSAIPMAEWWSPRRATIPKWRR